MPRRHVPVVSEVETNCFAPMPRTAGYSLINAEMLLVGLQDVDANASSKYLVPFPALSVFSDKAALLSEA